MPAGSVLWPSVPRSSERSIGRQYVVRRLRGPLACRRGTPNSHGREDTVLAGRLLLQLPTLRHRLGALRACLPASQSFSTSYQPRDRGRRSHWLPGGTTTVRRSTGVGAVEPRDLDGQDPAGRRNACAADPGLIALWTGGAPTSSAGRAEIAAAGINGCRPRLVAAPDQAGPAEQQRISAQGSSAAADRRPS